MRQWTVDAFAREPFRGNPACVVEPFDEWPEDAWMQALAQENNQAETAFLRRTDAPAQFDLRWFTPATEVPLCGHATLASAHVLFAELHSEAPRVAFATRSGRLAVERRAEGYRMDFPADPPHRAEPPAGLADALGAQPIEVWRANFLVALLDDEAAVRGLRPDSAAMAALGEAAPAVVVAAEAAPDARYDVVSRVFAPRLGIAEDPTTGAAHTILTPLFAQRLGRDRLRFHQAFPGRGGDMEGEMAGDRVLLSGRAVTVMESRLRL